MDTNIINLNNCTNIDVSSSTGSGGPVLKASPRGETMRRRMQSNKKLATVTALNRVWVKDWIDVVGM